MRIVVFIPTCRMGGLDIIESSLERQDNRNFEVVVADNYFYEREFEWYEMEDRLGIFIEAGPGPEKLPGNKRNLAAAYNQAARWAVERYADVFISMQDYIWIPPNGISRFAGCIEQQGDSLVTGLTSISGDPPKEKITFDKNPHYSVFDPPYHDKPETISWADVRGTEIYKIGEIDFMECEAAHWEANWAGVSCNLFRKGIFWDEDFDRGIAYENVDFALQAKLAGAKIWLDCKNHAISLPHKKYFDGEEEEILEFSNKEFFEEKWGFKT